MVRLETAEFDLPDVVHEPVWLVGTKLGNAIVFYILHFTLKTVLLVVIQVNA